MQPYPIIYNSYQNIMKLYLKLYIVYKAIFETVNCVPLWLSGRALC